MADWFALFKQVGQGKRRLGYVDGALILGMLKI